MQPMSTIAIVIVNYNTKEHLRRCLDSILEARPTLDGAAGVTTEAEIIVIDNNSTDGSAEMVRSHYAGVTLLAKQANSGYGAAANEAIAHSAADAILLLNSDTLLRAGAANALLDYLADHPLAAIVGPRLVNSDGTLQASCYPHPTPLFIFLEESSLGRWLGYIPGIRSQYLRTWRHNRPRAVPWVLGAALAIRRDAFTSVGGFDPEFFMYFEEVDLCHRLRQDGWQINFAPVTTIVHTGGASTRQQYAAMQLRLFRSLSLYYHRYYHAWQFLFLRLSMILINAMRLLREALRFTFSQTTEERKAARAALKVNLNLLRAYLFSIRSIG